MAKWINSPLAVGGTAAPLPAAATDLNGSAPSYLYITVEDNPVRIRVDGTAPESGGTTGRVYVAGATEEFDLRKDPTLAADFRAIEETPGSAAVIQIAARF